MGRYKRYRLLSLGGATLCVAGFSTIAVRWQGPLSVWESLEILPCSLGVGLLTSSQFVGLLAGVDKSHLATALSTFFMSQQIGMMIGASASAAILRNGFYGALTDRLSGFPNSTKVSIIQRDQTGSRLLMVHCVLVLGRQGHLQRYPCRGTTARTVEKYCCL